MSHIGTLAEKSLHAGLKDWVGRDGDRFEVEVDGFVVDIVRGDLLIEIQTRHLYAMRTKLARLLDAHPIRLVHPMPAESWIVRQSPDGDVLSRRKSPKRAGFIDIFRELVRMPALLPHPNLSVQVLLTRQEKILCDDGQGSWRRGHWSIADRRLLEVVDQATFATVADYVALLPAHIQRPFTNRELAEALGCRPTLAGKMTYTLRRLGGLEVTGKRGNALLLSEPGAT